MTAGIGTRRFLAFIVTGGVAACVNFGSRFLYALWLSFSVSVVFAYLTGMLTAYVLARLFVFRTTQLSTATSALRFAIVNAAALLQTWLVSVGLYRYIFPYFGVTHGAAELAHAVGIIVPVFTSYLGHSRWSFADAR